ncbi:MAG: hypothetical protein EON60_08935 [Alphaproteobacteria bacterium]|nr:MAG: hypothetical protein EON60_08935 [Alphaproteobacteria bacterium]
MNWWQNEEVTWVSGLSRASVFEVNPGGELFYNRDYVSPEQAVRLMPWREVWIVASERVWKLEDSTH